MATVEAMTGPISTDQLGPTLMHEHVFTLDPDYVRNYGEGAWWDEEAEVARAIDKLRHLATKGITTIVDPTVLGLGRDIPRLARVAAQVPVQAWFYEGAHHAFNNDTSAERYDKAAADLAWGRTLDFLKQHLA